MLFSSLLFYFVYETLHLWVCPEIVLFLFTNSFYPIPLYQDKLSGAIIDTLIVKGDDIVSLSADNCPTDFNDNSDFHDARSKSRFKTDTEISHAAAEYHDLHRQLERWEPEEAQSHEPSSAALTLEETHAAEQHKPLAAATTTTSTTEWNQFEVNARRFQVKSTYQEELYTTPLDMTSIPQSVKDHAEKVAREIEAAQYGTLDPEKIGEGDLEDDEEARFGAVRGTGAYRQQRSTTGNKTRSRSRAGTTPPSPPLQPAAGYSRGEQGSVSGGVRQPGMRRV